MRSAAALVALAAAAAATLSAAAGAAPVPEPAGPHPRMLLDGALRAAWRADAAADRGPVASALRICREAREPRRYEREGYQGSDWAKALQSCLVAWAATDAPEHAATALRFFTALLDDLEVLGDGAGGDASAQRDSGYAIRNLGPFTAIAYDWLHDAPGMTPALRARARARWDAWLTWYRAHGYRARFPGTNYQAGFLAAATAIAIAQGGEAGTTGAELWRFVADELWAQDMAAALAPGGILEGGDWPEGWQYGPLAVGNYALSMRLARRAGISVPGVERWLASVLRRHVHGLSPTGGVYAGGDTQWAGANVPPRELTLTAIALGDAPAQERRWARGERARLQLADDDALLFDALGMAGEPGEPIPRASWPMSYVARATGTLYARTRWDDRAVWLVAACQRKLPADHRHVDAGTFVLSRGVDDAIVDPSPYGSLSSLTGNAPTVASGQLDPGVVPSQGRRSIATGWRWTIHTRSGVVAARCDYADQYRLDDRPSDVREAIRDLILLPGEGGTDASLVVVDRAISGDPDRALYLRFRVPGAALRFDDELASARLRETRLAIATVRRTSGRPKLVASRDLACAEDGPKGQCEAARFPVTDYRLVVDGPAPRAVHAIAVTAGAAGPAPVPAAQGGEGWEGVRIAAARDAVVVWPDEPGAALRYRAPRGSAVAHIVLDGPAAARLIARQDGDACAVEVAAGAGGGSGAVAAAGADGGSGAVAVAGADGGPGAGAGTSGRSGAAPALIPPLIATLDAACAVAADPLRPLEGAIAPIAAGTAPSPAAPPRRAGGCCGGHGAAPASVALAPLALAALLRRRRRAPRAVRPRR